MKSQLTPRRRRVAALGGATAAISASSLTFMHTHRRFELVMLAVIACLVVYLIVELISIRREEGCQ